MELDSSAADDHGASRIGDEWVIVVVRPPGRGGVEDAIGLARSGAAGGPAGVHRAVAAVPTEFVDDPLPGRLAIARDTMSGS